MSAARIGSRRRRPPRVVETHEFVQMMRRMVAAHRRRVAAGSPEDLAELIALAREVDAAIDQAARSLHDGQDGTPGMSWTQIAAALGISRQAARQRFNADDTAAAS